MTKETKVLFLLDSTANDDEFRYVHSLVRHLPEQGFDCKVIFTSGGSPSDQTFQVLGDAVCNRQCFGASEASYLIKLSSHINRQGYDAIIVGQSCYNVNPAIPHRMTDLYNLLKGEPKLFFIGHYCSKVTVQSCEELAPLKPTWIAVSTRVAQVVMPDYDPLIIHGCAEVPTSLQVNIRDEFGVSKDSRVIGFIGSVDDIDPSLLVEVSRRLKARLLIAGTGGNITKLSETETGPVKVVPTIPMNREDWYKAFDVFVYPVLNPGFTSLPLEALLCGCPVAMTPVSDMFNFCKDWMSFFHPGEIPTQITQAVIAAAGSNVSASREFVLKEFSPEKMASGWALSLLGDSS